MKSGLLNALLWWCLTVLIAIVLARCVTLVSARISWPLIILTGAGGLGLASRGLAELCGVRQGVYATIGLSIAVLILTAAQHLLSWRDECERQQRARNEQIERTLKQFPALAGQLPTDLPPLPTFAEFLTGLPQDQAARWSFWGVQAILEQAVALIVFWAWSYVIPGSSQAETQLIVEEPPA